MKGGLDCEIQIFHSTNQEIEAWYIKYGLSQRFPLSSRNLILQTDITQMQEMYLFRTTSNQTNLILVNYLALAEPSLAEWEGQWGENKSTMAQPPLLLPPPPPSLRTSKFVFDKSQKCLIFFLLSTLLPIIILRNQRKVIMVVKL